MLNRMRLTDDPQRRRWAAASSLLLHAALILLLINTLHNSKRGTPASNLPKALQITLAPPAPVAPPVPTPPPPPPKEIPKEEPSPLPAPLPTPTPPKPREVPKVESKPAGATTQEPTPGPPVVPQELPEESLLGRLHVNWLEPARVPKNFSCRIRIDYTMGGRIAEIAFLLGYAAFEHGEHALGGIGGSTFVGRHP